MLHSNSSVFWHAWFQPEQHVHFLHSGSQLAYRFAVITAYQTVDQASSRDRENGELGGLRNARKRTRATWPGSAKLSSPAILLHDVIYMTCSVQVASIIFGKFWYRYLAIPAFGVYQSFGLIKSFLPQDSEEPYEDEKTRKKREKMEKKASRTKFVRTRTR